MKPEEHIDYGWSLWDRNTEKCYAKAAPNGSRCKDIAREIRKRQFSYDTKIEFVIKDPSGNNWMYSLPNTGWRMVWKWSNNNQGAA